MSSGALEGLRVLDLATVFAAPYAATLLADFGAEVIKVEHPLKPDAARSHGHTKDGVGLWWKVLNRNKRMLTLDLSCEAGRDILLELVADHDVLFENFRPGTLERWGLGPGVLHEINPRLVIVRVTGFGQVGPRRRDAGFGTLAEAMSGFAAVTGQEDGPPTLPPLALADGIAGLAAAYAAMTALRARDRTGRGEVIDLSLIEPILGLLGPHITWYDQLGIVAHRHGNRSENAAPRNTYLARDGRWVAMSSSTTSVAERLMALVGRPELAAEPWFTSGLGRAAHADELDEAVGTWVARYDADDVVAQCSSAGAAAALIYDVSDVVNDPQYAALDAIVDVPDPELGQVKMQNVPFRMSEHPGEVRWAGRAHGSDTAEILSELGYDDEDLARLRAVGAIA